MLRIIFRVIALFGISCYLVAAPAKADQLKMECQVYTNEPLGAYAFLFDTASGSLSVRLEPRVDVRLMFGWNVKNWKLLFAQGGHAVFYDVNAADTIGGPVKMLSLNFEKPSMFIYDVGGDAEEAIVGLPQYKARCRRLN